MSKIFTNIITGSSKSIWRGGFLKGQGVTNSITSNAISNVKIQTPTVARNFESKSNEYHEDSQYTNPEELMCSALTSCYVITMSSVLGKKKFDTSQIHIEADAKMTMEIQPSGYKVTGIHINCTANIPDIDDKSFQEIAIISKNACAISKLMNGNVDITLDAKLIK